jgi:hypothetical protein
VRLRRKRRKLFRLRARCGIIGSQGFTPLCSVAGRLVRVAKLRRAARSYFSVTVCKSLS